MGLRGDEIPEFARVIAVADAFDSMTTTRSYRGARTVEEALVELRRCAGTQFDPRDGRGAGRAAVDEHGWNAGGQSPMFAPPDRRRVFDQDWRGLRPRRPDRLAVARGRPPMSGLRAGLDDAGDHGLRRRRRGRGPARRRRRSSSPPRRGGFVDVRASRSRSRAFIALGELVRITLPGGRDAAPIATAGALGYALLTR